MKQTDIKLYKIIWLSVILLGFFVSFSSHSNSQIVVIGSGTTINEINRAAPINISTRKAASYTIYTAAELTAGGALGAGFINELGYYVTNSPVYNIPNYEIQIKHTSETDAASVVAGGFTTVKNIGSYNPTGGSWDMISLDTPFEWNGVDNIVIRICWSSIPSGSNISGQLRVFNFSGGYRYRGGESAFGTGCTYNPNKTRNYKPQIRFVFQDETIWTGTANINWNNPSNWTAGVPNKDMDATIPSGTPFNASLSGYGYCRTLQQNGTLTLANGSTLSVNDDLINTGEIIDLGSEIVFEGNTAHELSSTNILFLNKLHSNSSDGITIVNRSIRIKDELKITKGIVNTADSLFLISDASGTARIGEIKTVCNFTIEMEDTYGDGWNGGFVSIFEDAVLVSEFSCLDGVSIGSFQIVAGRTMSVEYTSGSYENENSYAILDGDGGELFSDGTTPSTGEVYTLDVAGCEFTNGINGDIVMERYIDAGETYWRYFASAVEDPKIAQYLDDFTTAGFDGSPFPDFPFNSIYSYDETQSVGAGYVLCASTDEIITVGKGYQVWSGDTITGTEPFLVDLVGPANQGDITLPVTYTFSDTPDEDGWNLIGNPYASTIDWDASSWTKTNMANAIYIQDPDTKLYAAYVAGAGVNGGTKYIASQQSFWVLATDVSPELTIKEGVKSNVDAIFYAPEALSSGMNIQISGFGKKDEAVVRHVDGASLEMEYAYDAIEMFGGWGEQPQISLVSQDEKDLAIHSFDKGDQTWEIPIRIIVFETGMYELTFNQIVEMGVPCMTIEDIYTGSIYPVEEGIGHSFEISDTTYAPRFLLHIGSNYDLIKESVQCHDGSDGKVLIDLGVDSVLYLLTSELGVESGVIAGTPLELNDLKSGVYILELFDFEDMCGNDDFAFTISQPSKLEINSSIVNALYGDDGQIEIDVDGGVSPYEYEWSTGATLPLITGLTDGIYTVSVSDANNCMLDSVFVLNREFLIVDESILSTISGYYNDVTNQFVVNNPKSVKVETIQLFDIGGQLISDYIINSNFTSIVIDLPNDMSTGIYLLALVEKSILLKFGIQ